LGGRLLSGSSSELLQAGEIIALSHHERWDGKGYPNGIAEEEIPLSGRICAVSDVFDALTSNRPYKKAFSNKYAYEILREGRGTHFDPRVTDVFFDRLEEVEAIQAQIQGGELMGASA
jgi:putative two-component system response regulator